MPLQDVAPPTEVYQIYLESLEDYFGPHKPEVKMFHLPVGTLGLEQLAKGATLREVKPTGCRFFAAWPDGSVTSCEMTHPGIYGKARFRNIAQGDIVRIPFQRIVESHGLEAVQKADFTLEFLSIPSIPFEGLHLVAQGDGSLVLPLFSSGDFATDAVLDETTFLAQVRPIAAARLAAASTDPFSS